MAKRLKELAVMMEDTGLAETDEKELAEVKKASVALRDADAGFELQTVGPVREPVLICDRLRSEAMAEAARTEHDAPMLNIGLEESMRMAVAAVDKPRWDERDGRIVIEAGSAE